jgi:hypothetical protein
MWAPLNLRNILFQNKAIANMKPKAQIISFIGPTMWISSAKDGKMQMGAHMMVSKKI